RRASVTCFASTISCTASAAGGASKSRRTRAWCRCRKANADRCLIVAIAFYISGHGFGHASRDVEIINALGPTVPDGIVIRSAVAPALLSRTLRVPYTLLPGTADTGVVQATSVSHDDAATVEAARAFYAGWDERVAAEVEALRPHGVRLVVS